MVGTKPQWSHGIPSYCQPGGAVNTTASSVPLKHEPRGEDGGGGGEEAGAGSSALTALCLYSRYGRGGGGEREVQVGS